MNYLAAMRVYVRVVERGSMSAAARDLNMGQPAVSERIEQLEDRVGATLLLRNTRRMSVTDIGADFYERCKIAIEAADDAFAVVQKDASLSGMVRIAAPHGLGETVIPPVLLNLRNRHPRLSIDLVLNDQVIDPVTEGVDISLRLGELREGGFVARKLGQVRRVLVASPDYLARSGMPDCPGDLAQHPFGRVAGIFNNAKLPMVGANLRIMQAPIKIEMTMSHWRPLQMMLLGGAGIGVLQEPVCAEDLIAGRLIRLLPEFSISPLVLHLLYAATGAVPARTKTVVSFLENELSSLFT